MPNQDLRLRRKVVTTGEPKPKSPLGLMIGVATAAVVVPAMLYTAMHPATVSNTVHAIAKHFPAQVKDIHIAIRAARETPVPVPTPSATATSAAPTPAAKASLAPAQAALAAHLAHLKRAHELALAAHKRQAAGRTSDVNLASETTPSQNTQTTQTASVNNSPTVTPTPAQVAAAGPPQVPISEATPVYAPEIVVDARFTREVHPDYPEVAKAQNAQGTAVVLATIGPSGSVLSARIDQSTGNKLLDSAALQAARASGFEAPRINGKPATETYRLIYSFSL